MVKVISLSPESAASQCLPFLHSPKFKCILLLFQPCTKSSLAMSCILPCICIRKFHSMLHNFFASENRQNALWYLPTDYSKDQTLMCFKSPTVAIHPSILALLSHPCPQVKVATLVPHVSPQWPPLLSCSPPLPGHPPLFFKSFLSSAFSYQELKIINLSEQKAFFHSCYESYCSLLQLDLNQCFFTFSCSFQLFTISLAPYTMQNIFIWLLQVKKITPNFLSDSCFHYLLQNFKTMKCFSF